MLVYLFVLASATGIAARMQWLRNQQASISFDLSKIIRFYSLLLIVIMGTIAAWRKYVGTDYGNYVDIYNLSKGKSIAQVFNEQEPLWGVINILCANIFDSYISVFVITAFLTVFLLTLGIYKNSSNYPLSVFLLITGMYYFDLFNGMRQMLATAIMFASCSLIAKKKWGRLLVLDIIAIQVHQSALFIFLAFVYAKYVKPRSCLNLILIGLFFAFFVFFRDFSVDLIRYLVASGSSYSIYENILLDTTLGANVLRFALTAVPPGLALMLWRNNSAIDYNTGILINLSLLNSLFMLLAVRNWIFARFSMFLGIYNILLWPKILQCFDQKNKKLVIMGIVAVYCVYFYMIVHTDSNLLPYQSWIFGGVYA